MCVSVAPKIKAKILENTFEMVWESNIMYGIEVSVLSETGGKKMSFVVDLAKNYRAPVR
jgi:hypothetical protein